jgi:multiple sugar transport system permease protein
MKRATPYLLLLPALLCTVFVLVYPLLQNLYNSFHQVSLNRGSGEWIGFANYAKVFHDRTFWLAFWNTSAYATFGTLMALLIGLGFALLLNMKLGRISSVMNIIFTIPWVISPVVAGFAWKWLLNDNFGIVNYWLLRLGIIGEQITWLGDPATALICVTLARLWQFYPFAMVMFLAGLQAIPDEQYEAASVDGASTWRQFFAITLPNLKSVSAVLLLLGMIWSFNDFNMVFVMTRGGPIDASMVLPVLVREFSFVQFDLGKGSALSVVVFGLLAGLSILYLKLGSREEAE